MTTCPQCGGQMEYRSRRCQTCDRSGRKGQHRLGADRSGTCPRCKGPMNPRSTLCWDCSIATRAERHTRNTGPKPKPLVDRLISRLVWDDDCLVWTGSRGTSGYGQITIAGRQTSTHRAAYEIFVGVIPAGMTVDHLCGNQLCAHPFHLDICTRDENSRRAAARRLAATTTPPPPPPARGPTASRRPL